MSRRQSSRKSNRPRYYSPEAKKDAKAKAKATKQKQSKAKDDVRSLILDQASCSSSGEDEFDEDSSSSSEEETASRTNNDLSDSEDDVAKRTNNIVGNRRLGGESKATRELAEIERKEASLEKSFIDSEDDGSDREVEKKKRKHIDEDSTEDEDEPSVDPPKQTLKQLIDEVDVEKMESESIGLREKVEANRSSLINHRSAIKRARQKDVLEKLKRRRANNNTLTTTTSNVSNNNCNNVTNNNTGGNTTININVTGNSSIAGEAIQSIITQQQNPRVSLPMRLPSASEPALPSASTPGELMHNRPHPYYYEQPSNTASMASYQNQMPNNQMVPYNQMPNNQMYGMVPYYNQMPNNQMIPALPSPAVSQMNRNAYYQTTSAVQGTQSVSVDDIIQRYLDTVGEDAWITTFVDIYNHYRLYGNTSSIEFSVWRSNQRRGVLTPIKVELLRSIGILD